MITPDARLNERVAGLLGARPVRWESRLGGYTQAGRWSVRLADGRSAFIKAAVDAGTAGWLRTEHLLYRSVRGPFMPAFLGFDDGEWPILALEDLSAAHWPPPWTPPMVDAVLEALDTIHRTPPPPGLPRLTDGAETLHGWPRTAADPEPFLRLGLCSRRWLETALPSLLAADAAAVLDGGSFLHLDVRSDNIAIRDGHAVLVDWNWACVGNAEVDIAAWLPTLHAEGGPEPEVLLPDAPEMAALFAGYFSLVAGKPPLRTGCQLRERQREWLRSALHWAARALDLPCPEGC